MQVNVIKTTKKKNYSMKNEISPIFIKTIGNHITINMKNVD